MKKIIYTIAVLFITTISYSQVESAKQVFNAPNLKEAIAKHKLVAILPYKATIEYKRLPKNYDAEANKQEELSLSSKMQTGMYTYMLRKADDFTVSFQDIERTNALLKKAGIWDRLDEVLPDSIAKILGVDAVIKCSYVYRKTSSDGGAIVKSIIGFGGKTGDGTVTMQIYDGANGELLWRFYKEMNESFMSNSNEIMERMMRKIARNFPYEK